MIGCFVCRVTSKTAKVNKGSQWGLTPLVRIYDEKGYLMTNIPSAGTADLSSPSFGNIGDHRKNDVNPYDLARQIDSTCGGNGEYVAKYYEVRPSK